MMKCNKVSFFLFFFFFISCAFDPVDYFGFKKIFFLILIAYFLAIYILKKIELSVLRSIVFLCFFTFGIVGFFFYIINFRSSEYDSAKAVSYTVSFFLMFIFIFLNNNKLKDAFILSLNYVGALIIFFTVIITIGFIYFGDTFSQLFFFLNYTLSNSFITYRSFGPIDISMVYLKSIVLLFPISVIYYESYKYSNKKVFFFLLSLSLISLCLSGTRTNILLSVGLAFVFIISFFKASVRQYIYVLSFMLLPLVIFFILGVISGYGDESYSIKASLFNYYIKIFTNDISYLFIGDGFGSIFYIESKFKFASGTELVYLDLIKYFGVVVFSFFMTLLLYPFIKFIKSKDVISASSYLCYLLVSATNPLLISSTGMIALMYYFDKALSE